jgi:hypothetical protein
MLAQSQPEERVAIVTLLCKVEVTIPVNTVELVREGKADLAKLLPYGLTTSIAVEKIDMVIDCPFEVIAA